MDQELDKEQAYLREVRAFMEESARIRLRDLNVLEEKTDRLFRQAGGTFSQEYELTRQSLELARLRQSRTEDSSGKPYFGRIDFRPRLGLEAERLYIGKHAVRDNDSTADLVIDWRAPVAELYYSGTIGRNEFKAPSGFIQGDLTLKRRFTYTSDALPVIDRYFDEGDQILISSGESEGKALQDEFLRIHLEESSTEKLREIVATIAREQNQIIRAPKNIPIIVQGAAGAGKTTVALHRLAYLLYLHQDTLKGEDVCIIAPNRLFLDYISEVLPDLGTRDVMQTTLEDLILRELKIRKYRWNKDDILRSILEAPPKEAQIHSARSRLKGSRAYMDLLDAMAKAAEEEAASREPVLVEGEVLFSQAEIARLLTSDLVYLPLNARRSAMETYFRRNLKARAEAIAGRIEQRYQGKIQALKNIYRADEDTMRRRIIETYAVRDEILKNLANLSRRAIKDYFSRFREVSVLDLYETCLHQEDFLAQHLDGQPDEGLHLTAFDRENLEADDLSALMYLSLQLNGSRQSWSHIVVDEAQDYTLLQLEVIRRLARQDSLTLVGDLAQGIYSYRAIGSWQEVDSLFAGGSAMYELSNSYRSTIEIIEEANRTLRQMELPLPEAVPVLRHGRAPIRRSFRELWELPGIFEEILAAMARDGRSTLALVTRTSEDARALHKPLKKIIPGLELIAEHQKKSRLKSVLIPSYMTKGLEFDCVVLMDEAAFTQDPLDLRLKYVSLTRALHLEYILSRERAK